MPNHVRNLLKLEGNEEQIKELVEKFGTYHPRSLHKNYDDTEIICHEKGTDNFVGWFNPNTNIFTYAGSDRIQVQGLPDTVEYEYNEAFTQMPDFNEIVPMPDSLSCESGSNGDLGLFILTGKHDNFLSKSTLLDTFWNMSMEKKFEALNLGKQYVENKEKYGHETWYTWCRDNWGTKWNSYSCKIINVSTFRWETAWSNVSNLICKMSEKYPELTFYYKWADEDISYNVGNLVIQSGNIIEDTSPNNGTPEAYELYFEVHPHDRRYYVKKEDGTYEYNDDVEYIPEED